MKAVNVLVVDNQIHSDSSQLDNEVNSGVYASIIDTVGNTPLVALPKLSAEYNVLAKLMAKLEFFNPMSSTKDRPAKAMIDALIRSPDFSENTHIIEATSGNNGVSCAWLCAIYDIRLTIVIPEHMSLERRKMIKHFGAELVTTPKALGTKGAIDLAKELVAKDPNAVSLDQFSNCHNADAHAQSTATEIWRDTAGQVDIFVAGVGTGGSITGIGKTLKKYNPQVHIVAVEPKSCPILSTGRKGIHAIQGLSSGHVPELLDRGVLDEILTVSDDDALDMARKLARTEGIAVGISSGATVAAAIRLAQMPEHTGKNIVMICADTAERYYSTALFGE